ncbi:MAG: hypothetical protein ACFFCV_12270 [Promethearchaeota archaeon]
MPKSEFYDIIKSDDIRVSIPKTSHFSIGTSPYYAHQHGLAVDIYQNLTLKSYDVLSPISGKIFKIKPLRAPKPKFPDGVDKDYLLLISNFNNPDILWKIMHIKPYHKEGETIEVGDILGETIRNGYFAYWSSPHLHLEIRSVNDAVRARGGINFSLALKEKHKSQAISENVNTNRIPVTIHSIYPEMILVSMPKNFYRKILPIYGVITKVGNKECILDGGVPHYKIGTVISQQDFNSDPSQSIFMGNKKIGSLHEINGQFGFFKFSNVKFLLNNIEIRGISLYLANFLPLIKIIPYTKNEFSFTPNSIQYLSII